MASAKNILIRYGVSTLGLIIVTLGVALSIKSNLGIAPLSCIPTILSLRFTAVTIGTFTWAFNLLFVALQALILRKEFSWTHLLQIVPLLLFGVLLDGAVWLFDAIQAPATTYWVQIALCLTSVLVTAVGIRLEVVGQGWILPADNFLNVITQRTKVKFSVIKVILDVTLVAITVLLALLFFGLLTGNGFTMVVREGTLIQALLTGLCMHFTDPLVTRLMKPVMAKAGV